MCETSCSTSPPVSPRRQSRRRLRTKSFTLSRRESFFAGIFLRRNLRYMLVLSLFYISGFLVCVCTISSFLGQPPVPGSVYRSDDFFQKLRIDLLSDNSTAIELSSVWKQKRNSKEKKPCPQATGRHLFGSRGSGGYLIVDANGGLNQQRSSICNAVAVAGLLNAVLVIPRFEFNNVWRDPSEFGDIYDVKHFIATLKGHVEVVHELPNELMEKYEHNVSNIRNIRVPAWAPISYYLEEVAPVLMSKKVIRIAPFANRLSMNVPSHIQFLRCLANYEALKFSHPISTLANKLVNRMINKSLKTSGKYVSIHLRFEEDMVAFSCCVYNGGKAEKIEMDSIREKGWKGKFKRRDRIIRPGLNRINGKCPLTPLEVGMMLRGMGFDNNTSIYLASGKIYRPEKYLAPLVSMFPLLQTKESITKSDELAPFEGYSSRLAALDYLVCLYSEAFVTTQGGNFPHFLMGHRRFLNDGHAKTIKPNKPKLVLLMQDMNISWTVFKDQMEAMLAESDREGIMVPRPRKSTKKASIYTFPLPDCRCLQKPHNSTLKSTISTQILDH